MKQFILIVGLTFTFAVAHAQVASPSPIEVTTPAQKAHTQAMKMQKTLTLSDAQRAQVEVAIQTKIEKIAVITGDASKTADVQQTEINAARDSYDHELAGILTPDQYALYLHKKDESKARSESAR